MRLLKMEEPVTMKTDWFEMNDARLHMAPYSDPHFDIAVASTIPPFGMTDDKLSYLLTKLPPRSVLLLEDADAAFRNRRQVDADGYSGGTVTFSGLLNALDGVAAGALRGGRLWNAAESFFRKKPRE